MSLAVRFEETFLKSLENLHDGVSIICILLLSNTSPHEQLL